jgi:hypothetical protein
LLKAISCLKTYQTASKTNISSTILIISSLRDSHAYSSKLSFGFYRGFPRNLYYFQLIKSTMKTSSLVPMLLIQLLLAIGTPNTTTGIQSAGSPTVLFTTTSISTRVSPTGSFAGGTTVYIFGTNFSPDPTQVSVAFGSYPCALVAGSSSSSMLACTTSAATSPTSLNNLPLIVTIQGQTPIYCSSSNCVFSYSSSKTPVVQ